MGVSRTTPTVPNPPSPQNLLDYNPIYRVLICTQCHYSIQPSGLPRHLKEIHEIRRSARHPYLKYAAGFELASPEDVFLNTVKAVHFPIRGLTLWNGLRCMFKANENDVDGQNNSDENSTCGHLCISEKRMRSHWLAEHGRIGVEKNGDWTPAKLQTFFRGNLLRYFASPTPPLNYRSNGVVSDEIHEAIISKWVPERKYKTLACGRGVEITIAAILPLDKQATIINNTTNDILQSISSNPASNYNLDLDEKDRHLFIHYVNYTAATIATDSTTLQLWQSAVPLLCQLHPFLLDGVLALAALHLAHTTPTASPLHSQYLLLATTHQDTAMPIFRSLIESVTPATSHAVYAFSHLLVLYCFASESQDERLFIVATRPDLSPMWLHFLRVGCRLLCHVWDELESGPVKALASAWDVPEIEIENNGLTPLVQHLLSFVPSPNTPESWTESEISVYKDTALLLGRAFANAEYGETFTTWDALRIWPMCIMGEYLEMLRGRHVGALVLLGWYCLLLRRVEGNWYFEGRATGLLRSVVGCLEEVKEEEGRERWLEAIRGVIEEIGVADEMSGKGV